MSAKALITGVNGQDGRLLAQYLVKLGYEVHGITRQSMGSIPAELMNVKIHQLDLEIDADLASNPFDTIVAKVCPDHAYHLAAANSSSQTSIAVSSLKLYRSNIAYPILFANSLLKYANYCRTFWAGSVHQYPIPESNDQHINERTPAKPRNTYGWTKQVIREYIQEKARENGLWSSFGILFNHESYLRPSDFLLAKICSYAVRLSLGKFNEAREAEFLSLRSLLARVDWCSAHDVIRGMHLSLIADHPGEYVFGSGKAVRVLDIIKLVSTISGLDLLPLIKSDDLNHPIDSIRYNKPPALIADITWAKSSLGWTPRVSLEDMVAEIYKYHYNSQKNISDYN